MKKVILFVLITSSFLACVKPDAPLVYTPSIYTWSGTDPMSCEINGVPWLASVATYSEYNGWKGIAGLDGNFKTISIALRDISVGTEYFLKDSFTSSTAFYTAYAGGKSYMTSDKSDNRIKILQNDSLIRGYFFFQTFDDLTGTTNKITKGYFNIHK